MCNLLSSPSSYLYRMTVLDGSSPLGLSQSHYPPFRLFCHRSQEIMTVSRSQAIAAFAVAEFASNFGIPVIAYGSTGNVGIAKVLARRHQGNTSTMMENESSLTAAWIVLWLWSRADQALLRKSTASLALATALEQATRERSHVMLFLQVVHG
jgi:hypothetical protein